MASLPGILTSIAGAQSGVSWSTNHYAVVGGTVGEIQRSMDRARPWKRESAHLATTEWNIRTRFAVVAFQNGFRCSGFTTQTSIRITMPRWSAPETASSDSPGEWKRFHDALLGHEAGHGRIALAAAAEMHRQVGALGTESDRDVLKQRVEQLVEQVTVDYRQREADYDRLTEHGATQGARLHRGPARDGSPRGPNDGNERRERERQAPE